MKKTISLALAALMLLAISACGAKPGAADYYAYIRDTIIPETGLYALEVQDCPLSDNAAYCEQLMSGGAKGLLSAVVYDFDKDGSDDLLTLSAKTMPMGETNLGRFMYDPDSACFAIEMRLYNRQKDGIALSDAVSAVTEMEYISFGAMYVGVQQSEGTTYIFSRASMEDSMTYGASPFEVYHVEDGKFVLDRMDGSFIWGQSSVTEDVNAVLGTRNLKLSDSGLNDAFLLTNRITDTSDENLQKLEKRALCYIRLDISNDMKSIRYTPADYTGLREALDGAAAVFTPETVEKSEAKADTEYQQQILDIVAELDAYDLTLVNQNEDGAVYYEGYRTASGNAISFNYNEGKLRQITVNTAGNEINDEWVSLWKAIIASPTLGLSEDVVAALSSCGTAEGSTAEAGGMSIRIGRVGSYACLINFPQ